MKKISTADIVSGETQDMFFPPSLVGGPGSDILKKPVEAIHILITGGILSKTQRLAFNVFLKKAHETKLKAPDGAVITRFKIDRKEFIEMIGYTSGNRAFLKQTLSDMQNLKVKWDVLQKDGEKVFESCVLIPRVGFTANEVFYTFDEQILQTLLSPTVYSRINLSIQRQFSLATSAALYEWCSRYRTNPSKKTSEIDWQKWRWAIYGVVEADSHFNEYKFFKRDKLKPAIEEINRISDLFVELVENRQGTRKVQTLYFKVQEKEIFDAEVKSDEWKEEWIRKLGELGIAKRERSEVVKKYSVDVIEAHYSYTLKRMEDKSLKDLKSPGSYFLKAIEYGYANDTLKRGGQEEAQDAAAADITIQYKQARNKEASELFLEITDDERESLVSEYNAQIEFKGLEIPADPMKRTRRDMAPFFAWFANKTWGEPKAEEVLQFAVKSGMIVLAKGKQKR